MELPPLFMHCTLRNGYSDFYVKLQTTLVFSLSIMDKKCLVFICQNHQERDDKHGLSYRWSPSIGSSP